MSQSFKIAPARKGFQTVFTSEDRRALCMALSGAEYQLAQIRGHMAELEIELRRAEANVIWAWRYVDVEEPTDADGNALRRSISFENSENTCE